jgi:hypothetical protein
MLDRVCNIVKVGWQCFVLFMTKCACDMLEIGTRDRICKS